MDNPSFENSEKTKDDEDKKANGSDLKAESSSSTSASASDDGKKGCCCTGCCNRIGNRFRNCWKQTKGGAKELKDLALELEGQGKHLAKKSCTLEAVKRTFPIIKWLPKYR